VSWSNAACKGRTDVFYGPDDETPEAREFRERRAKAICATCPVLIRRDCLEHALTFPEKHGVWAGRTAGEIGNLRRARSHRKLAAA
jgi:WhiB family redox-sensing transcriptional regulator